MQLASKYIDLAAVWVGQEIAKKNVESVSRRKYCPQLWSYNGPEVRQFTRS
jgi:hypothetical protein